MDLPECGRSFGRVGQSHTCVPAGSLEASFAGRPAWYREAFDRVEAHLRGSAEVVVEPVQVGVFFKRSRSFAEIRPMKSVLRVGVPAVAVARGPAHLEDAAAQREPHRVLRGPARAGGGRRDAPRLARRGLRLVPGLTPSSRRPCSADVHFGGWRSARPRTPPATARWRVACRRRRPSMCIRPAKSHLGSRWSWLVAAAPGMHIRRSPASRSSREPGWQSMTLDG